MSALFLGLHICTRPGQWDCVCGPRANQGFLLKKQKNKGLLWKEIVCAGMFFAYIPVQFSFLLEVILTTG